MCVCVHVVDARVRCQAAVASRSAAFACSAVAAEAAEAAASGARLLPQAGWPPRARRVAQRTRSRSARPATRSVSRASARGGARCAPSSRSELRRERSDSQANVSTAFSKMNSEACITSYYIRTRSCTIAHLHVLVL